MDSALLPMVLPGSCEVLLETDIDNSLLSLSLLNVDCLAENCENHSENEKYSLMTTSLPRVCNSPGSNADPMLNTMDTIVTSLPKICDSPGSIADPILNAIDASLVTTSLQKGCDSPGSIADPILNAIDASLVTTRLPKVCDSQGEIADPTLNAMDTLLVTSLPKICSSPGSNTDPMLNTSLVTSLSKVSESLRCILDPMDTSLVTRSLRNEDKIPSKCAGDYLENRTNTMLTIGSPKEYNSVESIEEPIQNKQGSTNEYSLSVQHKDHLEQEVDGLIMTTRVSMACDSPGNIEARIVGDASLITTSLTDIDTFPDKCEDHTKNKMKTLPEVCTPVHSEATYQHEGGTPLLSVSSKNEMYISATKDLLNEGHSPDNKDHRENNMNITLKCVADVLDVPKDTENNLEDNVNLAKTSSKWSDLPEKSLEDYSLEIGKNTSIQEVIRSKDNPPDEKDLKKKVSPDTSAKISTDEGFLPDKSDQEFSEKYHIENKVDTSSNSIKEDLQEINHLEDVTSSTGLLKSSTKVFSQSKRSPLENNVNSILVSITLPSRGVPLTCNEDKPLITEMDISKSLLKHEDNDIHLLNKEDTSISKNTPGACVQTLGEGCEGNDLKSEPVSAISQSIQSIENLGKDCERNALESELYSSASQIIPNVESLGEGCEGNDLESELDSSISQSIPKVESLGEVCEGNDLKNEVVTSISQSILNVESLGEGCEGNDLESEVVTSITSMSLEEKAEHLPVSSKHHYSRSEVDIPISVSSVSVDIFEEKREYSHLENVVDMSITTVSFEDKQILTVNSEGHPENEMDMSTLKRIPEHLSVNSNDNVHFESLPNGVENLQEHFEIQTATSITAMTLPKQIGNLPANKETHLENFVDTSITKRIPSGDDLRGNEGKDLECEVNTSIKSIALPNHSAVTYDIPLQNEMETFLSNNTPIEKNSTENHLKNELNMLITSVGFQEKENLSVNREDGKTDNSKSKSIPANNDDHLENEADMSSKATQGNDMETSINSKGASVNLPVNSNNHLENKINLASLKNPSNEDTLEENCEKDLKIEEDSTLSSKNLTKENCLGKETNVLSKTLFEKGNPENMSDILLTNMSTRTDDILSASSTNECTSNTPLDKHIELNVAYYKKNYENSAKITNYVNKKLSKKRDVRDHRVKSDVFCMKRRKVIRSIASEPISKIENTSNTSEADTVKLTDIKEPGTNVLNVVSSNNLRDDSTHTPGGEYNHPESQLIEPKISESAVIQPLGCQTNSENTDSKERDFKGKTENGNSELSLIHCNAELELQTRLYPTNSVDADLGDGSMENCPQNLRNSLETHCEQKLIPENYQAVKFENKADPIDTLMEISFLDAHNEIQTYDIKNILIGPDLHSEVLSVQTEGELVEFDSSNDNVVLYEIQSPGPFYPLGEAIAEDAGGGDTDTEPSTRVPVPRDQDEGGVEDSTSALIETLEDSKIEEVELGGCWIEDIACVETVISEETIFHCEDELVVDTTADVSWEQVASDGEDNVSEPYSELNTEDILKDSNSNLILKDASPESSTEITHNRTVIKLFNMNSCDENHSGELKSCDAENMKNGDSKICDAKNKRTKFPKLKDLKNSINKRNITLFDIDNEEKIEISPKKMKYEKNIIKEKLVKKCTVNIQKTTSWSTESNLFTKGKLITKGAQKYIPPDDKYNHNLKCKLPLPEKILLSLKQTPKIVEITECIKTSAVNKHKQNKLLKTKPNFEDVLKQIDETNISQSKMKLKNCKPIIPKMIIKKNEMGSHYTSTPRRKTPDLTGNKWQPWVCLQRNSCIEKMVKSKRMRASHLDYSPHRKERAIYRNRDTRRNDSKSGKQNLKEGASKYPYLKLHPSQALDQYIL